jgi:hypothetical protein
MRCLPSERGLGWRRNLVRTLQRRCPPRLPRPLRRDMSHLPQDPRSARGVLLLLEILPGMFAAERSTRIAMPALPYPHTLGQPGCLSSIRSRNTGCVAGRCLARNCRTCWGLRVPSRARRDVSVEETAHRSGGRLSPGIRDSEPRRPGPTVREPKADKIPMNRRGANLLLSKPSVNSTAKYSTRCGTSQPSFARSQSPFPAAS